MFHRHPRDIPLRSCPRIALIVLGLILSTSAARAGLILSAPTGLTAVRGSGDPVNFFDVTLTADAASPTGPFAVNGFNVRLTLSPASGVSFTRATTGTAVPSLFASVSTLGFDFTVSGGGTIIDFSDFGASQTDVRSVAMGNTFGLGRVFFNVSALAPVSPPLVTLVVDPASDVVDPVGVSFAPALANGTIRVDIPVSTSVPEPSSLTLCGLGAMLSVCAASLRRPWSN